MIYGEHLGGALLGPESISWAKPGGLSGRDSKLCGCALETKPAANGERAKVVALDEVMLVLSGLAGLLARARHDHHSALRFAFGDVHLQSSPVAP